MDVVLKPTQVVSIFCDESFRDGNPRCAFKTDTCIGVSFEKSPECDYITNSGCKYITPKYGAFCPYEKQVMMDRSLELINVFYILSKKYTKTGGDLPFYINRGVIGEICMIYVNELKVVRLFHNEMWGCDDHRRAGYLAKLILRHRPINIKEVMHPDPWEDVRDRILQINELYAIFVFNYFLKLDVVKINSGELDGFYDNLLHLFSHSDLQPEVLSCMARLLKALAPAPG